MSNQFNIKPIKKVRVSEEVFKQMKSNIILKIWDIGSKLPSEAQLSEMFAVSRTTVRAAIQKLVAIGLAETINGEGTYVISRKIGSIMLPLIQNMTLNPADILELLEFRQAVEMLSCELAAQRGTKDETLRLADIVNEMSDAIEAGDKNKYSRNDVEFHKSIAKMSKNTIIQNVLEILEDFMLSHIIEMNEYIGWEMGYKYHIKIYQAIKNGDSSLAKTLICENIDESIAAIQEWEKEAAATY